MQIIDALSPGDVIIAPPKMQDKRFSRAVIMLTHQREGYWFGLALNKPSEHTVNDLGPEMDVHIPENYPLFWGGPVNPQTIWMLHSTDWSCEHTVPINRHWAMTSNVEMFHCLADGDQPRHHILTFGFCGWGQGQLEGELAGVEPWTIESSWLTWRRPDTSKILQVDPEELWRVSCEQSSRQAVNTWLV
jgi:putative transcriptional regulator